VARTDPPEAPSASGTGNELPTADAEADAGQGRSKRRLWAVVAILAVVLLVGGLLTQSGFRHQVLLSISRRTTPFTELYFTDYEDLPKALPAGGAETIGFTIANHMGEDSIYDVVVTAAASGGVTTVGRMQLAVRNGDSAVESAEFVPSASGTYEVVVQLVGIEQIHYVVLVA